MNPITKTIKLYEKRIKETPLALYFKRLRKFFYESNLLPLAPDYWPILVNSIATESGFTRNDEWLVFN